MAPIAAVLFGLILGQIYTNAWDSSSGKISNSISISDQEIVNGQEAVIPHDVVNTKELNHLVNSIGKFTDSFNAFKIIEEKRNLNSIGAASALPQSTCVNQSQNLIRILKCNSIELPYRLFAFLFRPLIFFDKGSLFLELASLENLGWILILPYGLIFAFRRDVDQNINFIKFYLVTFILTLSVAASLYEGNLGTAFRHKSSILWPLILILLLSRKINAEQK